MRKIKKVLPILLGALFAFASVACEKDGIGDSSEHVHTLKKTSAKKATCMAEGKIEYWTCTDCEKLFSDAKGETEIKESDTVLAKLPHTAEKSEGREASCLQSGRLEYWTCTKCDNTFEDEACTKPFNELDAFLGYDAHTLTHHEEVPATDEANGVKEHWYCSVCEKYYADEACKERLDTDDLVIYYTLNIPDFVVEVPEGRDPVVLQLSDTQIIDAGQTREGRTGVDYNLWATDQIEERCYDYLTEVITEINPNFIIITGDVIYGEFDDNGSVWTSFVQFMDSFEIPWSPVFGNHDNESKMGVDWQCEQLENAEYCLFEQKTLTGNGNYSVGIAQGGELKRVFYMLDTNGCGNASAESLANGHTTKSVGFGSDQIAWYTEQISQLKAVSPDTKISFAYHIQQAIFADAYAKYGFNQAEKYQDINIDRLEDKAEGDFGYIGRQLKGPWDSSYTVWKGMKALGVDSVFVGHEHCNSASVVYDGVRFQFGQKSSEYDRFNFLNTDGTVGGNYGYSMPKTSTPLIGGTVIVLSEDNGAIEDGYNYYCGFENGQIDWDVYKPAEVINVNGLQYGGVDGVVYDGKTTVSKNQMWGDGPVYAEAVKFDDTTNAWKVTAGGQGKLYINTSLMRGKTTFTFTLYMGNAVGQHELNPFALRVKPDDGSGAGIAGMFESGTSKKQYIRYQVGDAAEADEVRLELGVWKTYTVDITDIAEGCTEFSFNIATGNTLYLKDITIS